MSTWVSIVSKLMHASLASAIIQHGRRSYHCCDISCLRGCDIQIVKIVQSSAFSAEAEQVVAARDLRAIADTKSVLMHRMRLCAAVASFSNGATAPDVSRFVGDGQHFK